MKRLSKRIASSLAAGVLGVALSVPMATTANAVEGDCYSNLGWWSVHNIYCTPTITHVSILKGNVWMYANPAMPGQTSSQGVCWADAIGYTFV